MAQLNFHINLIQHFNVANLSWQGSNGSLSFIPIQPTDSISFGVLNLLYRQTHTSSNSVSIGLYSLNGGNLSLANSISGIATNSAGAGWISLTATSATQNITPGTWWLGLLFSTTGSSAFSLYGNNNISPGNAFPGGFMMGRMSASTNALPTSYATSDLDIIGFDAVQIPIIILTA